MNPLLVGEYTKTVLWDRNRRVWHLHGRNAGREGATLLAQEGHMFGPVELLVSEGARQDGATFERDVRSKKEWDFVVFLRGPSVRSLHAIHDAWFRGWSTREPCTLGVFTRYQGWTFQRYQLDGAPVPIDEFDPARNAAVQYQMSAVAMDPLVHHFDESQTWVNADGFGEGLVRARNAGNFEAWARYTMPGPGRYHIGDLGGGDTPRIVETPVIEEGETLRIDTHPRHRTARVYSPDAPSGRNVWGQLAGRRWFQPIPPGEAVDIPVRVTDGGTTEASVTVTVTPRSTRPY